MDTRTRVMTAEDLLALPDDGYRYELIEGSLIRMPPAGDEHGDAASELAWHLARHVRGNNLGRLRAAETGFVIRRNPDVVRAPDIAFISNESLAREPTHPGYRRSPPELVVEVVSPRDTPEKVRSKVLEWLRFGSREVWVVYPQTRTVRVHTQDNRVVTFNEQDTLGSSLFPDWSLVVAAIFA